MNVVARHFYELKFKLSFMEKKPDEFEDFFSSVMEKRYPADFIRVRPWGNVGDWKNDGYNLPPLSPHALSVLRPNDINAATTVSKIDEDPCHIDSVALRG